KVLSAPNLLRVGTAENIFVECQDCSGAPINVEIKVMNHPTKSKELVKTSVTLNSDNDFQQLGRITVNKYIGDFSRDPTVKQYVYLQAKFPDQELEKVVLVSFQSGYIFIQTDKTLYTPNSKVYYRMFALTPQMEPVEKDEQTQTDASIAIEIVVLCFVLLGTRFENNKQSPGTGNILKTTLIECVVLWKVVAKFQSNPQQSYSAEFEVKEYVLPSFEVKLLSEKPFFYVDSEELTINIKATYLFGKEVYGTAYVVFGIMENSVKKSLPHSLSRVPVRTHTVLLIQSKYINALSGSLVHFSVTGAEMVEAEKRGIQIVKSPYRITFTKTPKYFKPGMSFNVAVEVVNPDDSPAGGIPVVVNPGAVTAITAENGIAILPVNTQATDATLRISVSSLKHPKPNLCSI
uniref:Macroglobulin domain-containing protein n=1 Tax=Kryptolebias marmoratus TaxID=37003 RepID=A0A3Q2ZHH8_KRYMA